MVINFLEKYYYRKIYENKKIKGIVVFIYNNALL